MVGRAMMLFSIAHVSQYCLLAQFQRCAALETLGLLGERVSSSLYPLLQEMSGSDPSPQVRLRATRALLLLHGMQPAPLRIPIIDLTLEKLGEEGLGE